MTSGLARRSRRRYVRSYVISESWIASLPMAIFPVTATCPSGAPTSRSRQISSSTRTVTAGTSIAPGSTPTLRAAARDGGTEVVPARFVGAVPDGMGWCVTLARGNQVGDTLQTAWLIDATGRRAAVARRAGAARRRDDALVAFYTRFRTRTSTDLDGRTAVESVPDGWWYTARVPSGERVVAFLTDADLLDRAAVLSAAGFAARLDVTRYIRGLLVAHRYEPVGPPRRRAQTARLDRFGGPAWTAVGDAAISFDPLSSQGVLTALFTGFRAGMAVNRALAGDPAAIDEYGRLVGQIVLAYRRHREACYAAEWRWQDYPFWRRRLGIVATTAS